MVAPVCVVVPAYRAGRFIRSTVESVLAQTFTDFELVVLENGVTDDTAAIVGGLGDPRIRLERNENVLPMANNWNRAVELSRSPLVKVLCADDLIYPRCLETQVAELRVRRYAALVACRRDLVDADGATVRAGGGLRGLLGRRTRDEVARAVVRHGGNPIGEPGSVLFRREAFDATGGFATEQPLLMDLDLWVRLLDHGDLIGQGESLAAFRLHDASTTSQVTVEQQAAQAALIRDLAVSHRVPITDRVIGAAVSRLGRLWWNHLQSKAGT
ncbi:glycosyltransferase [Actinoplanes sp. KI2]|uniref:glycosyltransferase n=1 Tax=Actinoplanes sp. KI2 TaxID=2983315 RepID=UPI0021D5F962|nr:glycosyltransferase [Actinoplanes sp. KI2]MCU7724552.1 glycosyltransferase [Actinoplanes sp. KI2]